MCVCETIVVSSKFRVTRKPAVLVRRLLNFDLRIEENTSRDLQHVITLGLFIVVYYESKKREVKRGLMYEYRCDERLRTKKEGIQ